MIENYIPTYAKNALKQFPTNDNDLIEALNECYLMARRGKLDTADEHRFEVNAPANLLQLRDDIVRQEYTPSRSKAFVTFNPVIREIFAAQFRDRNVHNLLYALNGFWWDRHFINDSCSCRVGKGTLYAIKRVQHHMEKVTQAGSKAAMILKGDISGYFMSMSRRLLFEKILAGLEKQFPNHGYLYELCRYLWFEVIFDDPIYKVRMAGSKHEWDSLPPSKSLFCQAEGFGIVIGNLTSQLLSNIMLNEFDWYILRELGFRYVRYVDDFLIIVPEERFKEALHAFEFEIPEKLMELGLKMHPNKKYIQPVERGVPFLGQYVHRTYTTPTKRIRGNYYKAAKEYMMGIHGDETIISYLGMGKHTSQKKLNAEIFAKMGWEYNW